MFIVFFGNSSKKLKNKKSMKKLKYWAYPLWYIAILSVVVALICSTDLFVAISFFAALIGSLFYFGFSDQSDNVQSDNPRLKRLCVGYYISALMLAMCTSPTFGKFTLDISLVRSLAGIYLGWALIGLSMDIKDSKRSRAAKK